MATDASAFDLLRGTQRRARQAPSSTALNVAIGVAPHTGSTGAPGDELLAADIGRAAAGDIAFQGPLRPGTSAADERVGLWWAIRDKRVFYFPLAGPQGAPCAVHSLPKDVAVTSARCVVVLIGSVPSAPANMDHHGSAGLIPPTATPRDEPCSVVVCADFSVVVFSHGEPQHLPCPAGAPLGQAPAFAVSTAPPPGSAGIVLVVGTSAGRLLTLFLQKVGERFGVEVGALWPTTRSDSGLRSLLKRVRKTLGAGQVEVAAASWGDCRTEVQAVSTTPTRAVEMMPPSVGTCALFAALALGEEELAFYLHPRCTSAPELVWVATLSELLGPGAVTKPRLLAATRCREEPEGLLLLYASEGAAPAQQPAGKQLVTCADGKSGGITCLARLEWHASGREPPRLAQHHGGPVAIAQSPEASWLSNRFALVGGELSFMTTSRSVAVVAACLWDGKFVLSTVSSTPAGLEVADVQLVDTNIMGLALVSEGASVCRISVITPHGLLDCTPPKEPGAGTLQVGHDEDEDMGAPGLGAHQPLRAAHELYLVGQEDQAAAAVARACARFGANDVLLAVESRSRALMDAVEMSGPRWREVDEAVATRHLLFDKARDLHQWLEFLSKCGVWTRLGNSPHAIFVRKAACEACERVAAASRFP